MMWFTVEHTVEMYKVLPQAQLAMLPGGHGEYLGECTFENKGGKLPEIAAALMLGFLDGTSPQAQASSNELLSKSLSA